MRQFYKMKLIFFLFFTIVIIKPIFAQNQEININLAFQSKHFFDSHADLFPPNRNKAKFDIKYNLDGLSSQIALNYDEYSQFNFDRSYIQYTKGIATYGVGAIDRHWSFSKNTSLILSHNARPSKSTYLKLKNKFNYDWLHPQANWSLEIFNGRTEGSLNGSKSMLLGVRAVLTPIDGLNFELLQTSQWGGKGYNNGISALGASLFFDTNNGKNSNINKMAGFGVSYLIPINKMPLRIYGQVIGEDEAGNLPSCNAYLAGLEWSNKKMKYPTTLGIEVIDTRINTTTHGNCGPNTMYNNNAYDYVNYGDTMGVGIDTEGKSLEFFGQTQLSQKINIIYSKKTVIINDANYSSHRLSSNRQSGSINSLGISWKKDNLNFIGSMYNHGLNLNKSNIKNKSGIGFSASYKF